MTAAQIHAPYFVASSANFGSLATNVVDNSAPESGNSIGIAPAARIIGVPSASAGSGSWTHEFKHKSSKNT